jgi:hypothetical protein
LKTFGNSPELGGECLDFNLDCLPKSVPFASLAERGNFVVDLRSAGFASELPSLIICLGVTCYLTK